MRKKSIAALIAFLMAIGTMGGVGGLSAQAQSGIKRGGTVSTELQNLVFADVDPAYGSEPLWEADFMEAIFGELFTMLPNGKVGMSFASSAKLSNGNKTFTFTIKPGIKFTDGTPYDAQAVAYNINRDLSLACICAPDFAYVQSVKAIGPLTVQVQMKQPDSVIEEAFVDSTPDWIASPTAIKKMGKTAFGEHPVGAGPFEVSSIDPGSKVTLTANPHYYVKGEPYLSGLTFTTGAVDQSAYSSLQSGSTQIVAGIGTTSILNEALSSGQFDVKLLPGPIASSLEMNSFKPPFNNILAREAVSYALNPVQLKAINSPGPGGGVLVQDPQGPGGAYYEQKVPTYRGYNLAKAKQLVKQIGGLSFTLDAINTPASVTEITSIQSELAKAGINVKLVEEQLPLEMKQLGVGDWQAVTSAQGGLDPDVGSLNLYSRFSSSGYYTCCKDKTLDQMMLKTYDMANGPARAKVFDQIYSRIDQMAYIVPFYAAPENIIAVKNLAGLTAAPNPNGSVAITIPWATLHYAG